MMEKFYQRRHREQLVIAVAVLIMLSAFLFLTLWQPLLDSLNSKQEQFALSIQTQQQVTLYAQQILELQNQEAENGDLVIDNLTALVNESLQSSGLQLTRMQQPSADQVQIRLDNVEFGVVLAWLYDLEKTPGLVLGEMSVRPVAATQSGLVNITVGLSRLN